MTTVSDDLKQYENRKVIVTRNAEDGTAEEVEGTVQSANTLGILIKPKGKSGLEIIEAGDIIQVAFAPEKAKTLTAKYIKEIVYGNVRQHLLDRHGFTLNSINAMTEDEAWELHEGMDHAAADLGHLHGEKPKTPEASEADDASTEEGSEEDE